MPNSTARKKSQTTFKAPLAALAVSFALGIVWAHCFRASLSLYWFLAEAGVCILLGLLLLRAGWGRTAVGFVLASMVLTGVAASRRWEQRFPPGHVRYLESRGVDVASPVRLTGRVISTPYRQGYAWQFDLDAQEVESPGRHEQVLGKVRLRVEGTGDIPGSGSGAPAALHFNDVICVAVRLRRPHTYQNPGAFDFRGWMADIEDLYWVGTAKNFSSIEKLGHARGNWVAELIEGSRQRLLRGIDDLYPPWSAQGRYGAVLKAVLWGVRAELDATTIDDFRKTGLYHLLVIAGLHVGLLTLLVESLLRILRWRRWTRAFVTLGFLAAYALLVEQRAPTLRATVMIALYLLARLVDRDHSPLNAIGGVALILLYVRPAWLFESGFQLSFSAALLIVGVAVPILERTTEPYRRALLRLDDVLLDDRFSPRIAQTRLDLRGVVYGLRRRSEFFERFPALSRNMVVAPLKVLVWVANILVFSAVLQLGLLLPMAEIFHRVTLAGIGLNAAAIPVMTVLLALALPVNLLSVASPAMAAWPARVLTLVMTLLFRMTHLPALAEWLSFRVPTPPAWVAWGFGTAFVLAALALRYARRAVGPTLAVCLAFVILVTVQPFAARLPSGVLQLTALDCTPGDALFVVFPNGTTMLIDAGASRIRQSGFESRRWDPGEDIVSPFLWSLGLKKIDIVVISKSRADRLGGLEAILANFKVGEVWHFPIGESPEYANLLENLAERGIPTRTLMAGDAFDLGTASVKVLLPERGSVAPDSGLSSPDHLGWPTSGRIPAGPAVSGSAGLDECALATRVQSGQADFVVTGGGADSVDARCLPSPAGGRRQINHRTESFSVPGVVIRLDPVEICVRSDFSLDPNLGSVVGHPTETARRMGETIFRPAMNGAATLTWAHGALQVRTFAGARD